jgi:hypothetical protein
VADFDSGIRRFSRLAFVGRQPPLSRDKPAIGSVLKYFSCRCNLPCKSTSLYPYLTCDMRFSDTMAILTDVVPCGSYQPGASLTKDVLFARKLAESPIVQRADSNRDPLLAAIVPRAPDSNQASV